jgi:hypothetical protein
MTIIASRSVSKSRRLAPWLLAAAGVFGIGGAQAATIDFSGAGGGAGGFGNTLQFSDGGITLDAYAWGETGSLQTTIPSSFWYFQTAELFSFDTGLGICNRFEGDMATGCDTNEREIDTVNRDDLLVLFFDQTVSFSALSITVDPWDGPGADPNDRDLRYWISTVGAAPDLSTYSFNTLSPTFGPSNLSNASSSYNALTHVLPNNISGNLLLLSGDFMNRNCVNNDITMDSECEAWKLKSITVEVIPIPAAAWMLMSALGVLGIVRRRLT